MPEALLALIDEPEGPGGDITGGAEDCLYRVTNANDSGPGSLRAGAEAGKRWIVFDGDYTINLTSDLYVGGNVTIDGRGHHVTVTGHALRFKGPAASNVIVADLVLTHVAAVSGGATHLWFDRVTMPDDADEHIHITNPNPWPWPAAVRGDASTSWRDSREGSRCSSLPGCAYLCEPTVSDQQRRSER